MIKDFFGFLLNLGEKKDQFHPVFLPTSVEGQS